MDNIDEMIDTVSPLGPGVERRLCRCHDHKFDPIPATDYYALPASFNRDTASLTTSHREARASDY